MAKHETKASDAPSKPADERRAEAEGKKMADLALQRAKEDAEESEAVVEELNRREAKTREMLAAARKARLQAEG